MKFDELLNEKCSWSYRSQDVTNRWHNMDDNAENIQSVQTTLQISDNKCDKKLNDISPNINRENGLNDESVKSDEENTIQHKTFMKTYGQKNRSRKKKSKSKNIKTGASHFGKTKTTKISSNRNTAPSNSSTDEEVLQTRLSVMNRNTFKLDEYHSSTNLRESTLDKESILENDSDIKTSPIIIQAIPYYKRNTTNNSDTIIQISEINKEINNMEKTNIEITDRDSPSVEANYSNADIGSNSIQISNEYSNEQFDVKNYLEEKDSHEISLPQLMKNISFMAKQDSTNTELEKTKTAYDNFIVTDFLNGSFDINTYKLEKRSLVENYKNATLSNSEQFENNKSPYTTKQTNVKNTYKKNKNNKREINELVTGNKRAKHSDSYDNENVIFPNSPEILSTGVNKRSTRQKKITSKLQMEAKEINKKSENRGEFNLKECLKGKGKLSNKLQRNKVNDVLFNNEVQDFSSIKYINGHNKTTQIKTNTSQKRYKDNNITSDVINNSTPKRYSTRKLRNSSLVASRKIKEIEKLENLSDSSEEIMIESKQNSLKKGRYKTDKSRNFISDLNLTDEFFLQEGEDLCENVQNNFKKRSRKDKCNDFRSADESLNNNYYTRSRNKTENFISFKRDLKESKHMTWDILERELLSDFDNMPLTDEVNKTFILNEEEIIRKKEVVKDTNLFTVSNTSMMQTISKSKGNKYNMKYEINTESKFLKPKADSRCSVWDRYNIPQSKDIVHSTKSISILDRTIAAMEKCTANFIVPQVKMYDNELEDSLQSEDIHNNSDTNHAAQFHSSITFLANDNEQYYSNKLVGYVKKTNRRGKRSINIKEKMSACKMLNHQQSNYKNSEEAEHSKQSIVASRNYLSENSEKSWPVVPYSKEKHINPWNKLIKKLNLEEDYEKNSYLMENSRSEGTIKIQHSESSLIKNDLRKNLNNSRKNDKMLAPIDFQINKIKLDEVIPSEQGVLKLMSNEEVEPLVNHTPEPKNLNSVDDLILSNTGKNKNKKENAINENKDRKRLEMPAIEIQGKTSITEKQIKSNEETNIKQSLSYTFKIGRNGTLKLHSKRSSSSISSRESFTKSKKIVLNGEKSNKRSNYKSNKALEQYKKYLKNVFDKKDKLVMKDKIDNKSESNEVKNTGEDTPRGKTNNSNNPKTRTKLIAENEDDIFSLSSSDLETDNEKTTGLGLLCDLFDE